MDFLTSFISQTMVYATIYTLTSLGIVIAGRVGIFNVSAEGVMLTAASAGFAAAYYSGSWLAGFLAGAAVGGLFGLLLAVLHERYKVNQFILGISLVILGTGLSDLLYKLLFGVLLSAPTAPAAPIIRIPLLSRLPILSGFLNQDPLVYFMYLSTAAGWWFFYRSKAGLETRSVGEYPKAADVVGIPVVSRRILATVVGSAFIGLAGAYIPLIVTETYSPDLAAGRGFMAIGIAIFASWRPERAILGGVLFAAIEVLSFQLQMASRAVPYQFFLMLPFAAVLAVMILFKRRIEFPASIGKPYYRE